jgi:hypothetical protein
MTRKGEMRNMAETRISKEKKDSTTYTARKAETNIIGNQEPFIHQTIKNLCQSGHKKSRISPAFNNDM